MLPDRAGMDRRTHGAVRRHKGASHVPIAAWDELLTSTLTLGEVLVKPMEAGDEAQRDRCERAIRAGATVVPFDVRAAPRFAAIRRDRAIRAPDAIQLACAAAAGTDLFITNDDRLSRKTVPGIQFIQSLGGAFL